MSKKIQLHIPTPCHENWDNMSPVDKGRFCMSCQKKVIDFTGMNDEQLVAYFKKPAESVCGRFEESQLNRETRVPKKELPWVKYFFQFTLPAFLLSMRSDAQKLSSKDKLAICATSDVVVGKLTAKPVKKQLFINTSEVKGVVLDESNLPVSYATVKLKNSNSLVHSDSSGNFSINVNEGDAPLILIVSCIGYKPVETEIIIERYTREINLKVKLSASLEIFERVNLNTDNFQKSICTIAGGVISGVRIERTWIDTLKDTIPLKDTIQRVLSKFSIYPNPVTLNQCITIENKKLPEDIYDIEFINLAGQTINKQQLFMGKKDKIYPKVHVNTAGIYFIRLTGSKSSKVYTEKIIVQ